MALPDGGLRLRGHGSVPRGRFPLRIVDSDGRTVGLGERWQGNTALFGGASSANGWLAYVAPGTRTPLRVHVGGDTPCLMPGPGR